MVNVRKPPHPYRAGGGKPSSSCSLPMVLIGFALVLGGTMLLRSDSPNVVVSSPMGVRGTLDASRVRKQPPPPKKVLVQEEEPAPDDPADFVGHEEVEEAENHDDAGGEEAEHVDSPPVHHDPDPEVVHKEPELPPDDHEDHHDPVVELPPVIISEKIVVPEVKKSSTNNAFGDEGAPIHKIVLDKKGTGPTTVGYVKDFQNERANPEFRSIALEATDASETVASLTKESKVTPCRSPSAPSTVNPKCLDDDTPLIAYNTAPFPRTWCGTTIPAGGAVAMEEHCSDPIVHVFSSTESPPIDGHGMTPITIKSHSDIALADLQTETVECDIPCQQEQGMVSDTKYIDGEVWQMKQSTADGVKMERTDFREDIYHMNQSWQSSIPLSLYKEGLYDLHNRPAVDYDSALAKGIYIVDSMCSAPSTKRHKYFGATSGQIPVDSFGKCNHNKDVPTGSTIDTPEGRIALMRQYRVVLAFDASSEKDHISPYVWEAFASGAVPVVAGADNIAEHMPPNSFIDVGNFQHWDDVALRVKEVVGSKEQWESYQTWRSDKTVVDAVMAKYEFTKTDPTCRFCRWAYAKKYGLGWDHGKQIVTDNVAVRKFCESEGLVSAPFQEQWVAVDDSAVETVHKASADAKDSCTSTELSGDVDFGSNKVTRTITQHDGVVDILVTGIERDQTDTDVVLRLLIPGIENAEGAAFANSHSLVSTVRGSLVSSVSIQDSLSKATVVADWETSLSSPKEGVVDIVILKAGQDQPAPDAKKHIRVITEDSAKVHDKMTEFSPSSFGKLMVKDFVDPIEVFVVDN